MIPRRVLLENFLTFAAPVELVFTDDEPLWVLGGPNGSGKSAVFDAITYALFECHRGGEGQKMDKLIRHGQKGFRVELDFEFAGRIYRIQRSRTKSGRSAKSVQKLDERGPDGEWAPVPGVNSSDELNSWVKSTLGQDFTSFSSSVLLRQGKADQLFTLNGTDRNSILKKIIGYEEFEKLAERIKDATKEKRREHEELKSALAQMEPATEADLDACRTAAGLAKVAWEHAKDRVDDAASRIERAKQWRKLQDDRRKLELELESAKARSLKAKELQAGQARHQELGTMLPLVKSIRKTLAELTRLNAEIDKATTLHDDAVRERDAAKAAAEQAQEQVRSLEAGAGTRQNRQNEIVTQTEQAQKHLATAKALEKLTADLANYPTDLAARHAAATAASKAAATQHTDAVKTHAEKRALYQSLKTHGEEIAGLEGGAKCLRCGQEVTAKHLKEERERVAVELSELETAGKAAKKSLDVSAKAKETAEQEESRLASEVRARDDLVTRRDATALHAPTASAADLAASIGELKRELDTLKAEAEAHTKSLKVAESTAATHVATAKTRDTEASTISTTLQTARQKRATLQGTLDAEQPRLSVTWDAVTLTENAIAELDSELQSLTDADVAGEYAKVAQDAALYGERTEKLQILVSECDAIDPADRLIAADADAARTTALELRAKAETDYNRAAQKLQGLVQQQEQYIRTSTDADAAERKYKYHKRADELLGEAGLMRDLLRTAEHEIIALGDDTLRQLTSQELSLEADDEVTGRQDKVLAVRIRKDGDTTGIDFISGSQRFRVAVSLALAIGRFAAGKRRPIEAVIIDEGFGSLDEDGLRAMAENLHELRRTQALKRIILVSHQKNFTEQFAAGYRLTPSPDGTTATRVG